MLVWHCVTTRAVVVACIYLRMDNVELCIHVECTALVRHTIDYCSTKCATQTTDACNGNRHKYVETHIHKHITYVHTQNAFQMICVDIHSGSILYPMKCAFTYIHRGSRLQTIELLQNTPENVAVEAVAVVCTCRNIFGVPHKCHMYIQMTSPKIPHECKLTNNQYTA